MATFTKDDGSIGEMLAELQQRYECYTEQIEARIKIDIVLAHADRDEDGEALNDALRHHGVKALGIARSIGKKDRAMGRGDAEIALDGDWWETHPIEEQMALLDHELYHIVPKRDRDGNFKKDDMRRPLIKLRPHDEEFGLFRVIAARHGADSQEQQICKAMIEDAGQYYWPDLLGPGAASGTKSALERLRKAAKSAGGKVSIQVGNNPAVDIE